MMEFRLPSKPWEPSPEFHILTEGPVLRTYKQAKQAFNRLYCHTLLVETRGNVSAAARLARKDRKDLYRLLRTVNLNPKHYRKTTIRYADPSF